MTALPGDHLRDKRFTYIKTGRKVCMDNLFPVSDSGVLQKTEKADSCVIDNGGNGNLHFLELLF